MPMRNPFKFFTELMHQRLWIVLWMYYLVLLNFSSALFWDEPLAKVIFFTFIISTLTIIGLYSRFGFEKIISFGHIFWLPLLIFLLPQFLDSHGSYRIYLALLSSSIIIALAFDTVDVWHYLTHEKSHDNQPRSVEKWM